MAANDTPASTFRYNEKPVYTTSNGAPVENPSGWQRTGTIGPLLLQDFHLIDNLAHFDRTFSLFCSSATSLSVLDSWLYSAPVLKTFD
jgi:hypothetical protein